MRYYSTNKKSECVSLRYAVVNGLAEDRGLYMPERINKLPEEFIKDLDKMSFQEISYEVAKAFFGDDVETDALKKIVYDTLSFDCPVKIYATIYGPWNFFMALPLHLRILGHDSWHACLNISSGKNLNRQ